MSFLETINISTNKILKKTDKLYIVAGTIFSALSAIFFVVLLIQIFGISTRIDYGSKSIFSLGAMLFNVYGYTSILIPIFFIIASLLCFLRKANFKTAFILASSVIPFFTIAVTENICRTVFSTSNDSFFLPKLIFAIILSAVLVITEFIGALILYKKIYAKMNGFQKKNVFEEKKTANNSKIQILSSLGKNMEKNIKPVNFSAEKNSAYELTSKLNAILENTEKASERAEKYKNFKDNMVAKETIFADAVTYAHERVKKNSELYDGKDKSDVGIIVGNKVFENYDPSRLGNPIVTNIDAEDLENKISLDDYAENVTDATVVDDINFVTNQTDGYESKIPESQIAEASDIENDTNNLMDNHIEASANIVADEAVEVDASIVENDAGIAESGAKDLPKQPVDNWKMSYTEYFALKGYFSDDVKSKGVHDEIDEKQKMESYGEFDEPQYIEEMPEAVPPDGAKNVFAQMDEDIRAELSLKNNFSVEDELVNGDDQSLAEDTQLADDVAFAYEATIAEDTQFADETEFAEDVAFSDVSTQPEDLPLVDEAPVAEEIDVSETETEFSDDSSLAEETIFADDVALADETSLADEAFFADETELADEAMLAEEVRLADEIDIAENKTEQKKEERLPPPLSKARAKFRGKYKIDTTLLTEYEDDKYWIIDGETEVAAVTLKDTLNEFKIEAEIVGIKKGPVVTMFEILPAPGVKLSKIVALQDNIALRLAASSVRIVAPIPGKRAVGIEIPNQHRSIVGFREIIEMKLDEYKKMAVPVILGKDILGKPQIIDLVKTPHLLIAGATGAGKSVCVNSMILSILYKRSPNEVRMIMIDPKIVELKLYNDIPHLLTPVITEPKRAFQSLQYCLAEMERRYSLLDAMGVRDLSSYNKRIEERKIVTEKLPYIIVIIDEFADLMATTGKELEQTLARLAAMSRAVGIHLVLATQRPSIDVITGLIKANIPSRIAFMVASKMDSRIIIDQVGAEKLLGKGDMLYASATDPFPIRIQGTFVSDNEVENVVNAVKEYGEPDYIDDEIFIDDEDDAGGELSLFDGGEDPLYSQALDIVLQAGKASASYIQRRLKIGYNRAARLVEEMEMRGIVGPANGSKPREVIHIP